jgi:hypothetical protein
MTELLDKMNEHAQEVSAGSQVLKASKITGIACYRAGEAPFKVYLRAYDGREMEWRPSDGTNELKRKMILGR